MTDNEITGGCLCGAVRYRAGGAPLWVAHCHCTSCRKAAGAPFVTWAGFAKDKVEWQGAAPRRYASSEGVSRGFCQDCGTSLTYEGARWPDELHLLVATFDDPEAVTPTAHVYWREHLSWLEHAHDLPRHAGSSSED